MGKILEPAWYKKRAFRERLEQSRDAKKSLLDVWLKRTPPLEWGRQLDDHVVSVWKKLPDPDKPFCYVEYVGKSRIEVYAEAFTRTYGWDKRQALDYTNLIYSSPIDSLPESGMYVKPTAKRNFENYAKAIAHLTKVKLSIVEDDERFSGFTPCKIVEGCYTRDGREHITKVTEFPNVGNRMGRYDSSSGQPREQRGPSVSVSQTLVAYGRATGGSSGTATSSNTTATVDTGRTATYKVPVKHWITSTTTAC